MVSIRLHKHDDLLPASQIVDAYFDHLLDVGSCLARTPFIAERGACSAGYACIFGSVPRSAADAVAGSRGLLSDPYLPPGK